MKNRINRKNRTLGPSADQIKHQLAAIEIPPNVAKKLKKFADQEDYKIVLSLGGGGAKGAVGNFCLVYLLDKLGLMDKFESVWGVSAGSMIGGAICSGMNMDDLIDIMATVRLRDFIELKAPPYATDKLHKFFTRIITVKTFEKCKIPFYVLATHFTGEYEALKVFSKGSLADAITASISIPDVFEAFKINGKTYCDGGLVENTPCVSVARHHQIQKRTKNETRKLAILSTCFGKENYNPHEFGTIPKILNLLGVYRYQLQLRQNELTRKQKGVSQLMINLDVPITKLAFNRMNTQMVHVYGQLLDKLSYICDLDNWNITY